MITASKVREILYEEIEKLRSGTTSSENLRVISNAVGKMVASACAQTEYNKLTGNRKHKISFLVEA